MQWSIFLRAQFRNQYRNRSACWNTKKHQKPSPPTPIQRRISKSDNPTFTPTSRSEWSGVQNGENKQSLIFSVKLSFFIHYTTNSVTFHVYKWSQLILPVETVWKYTPLSPCLRNVSHLSPLSDSQLFNPLLSVVSQYNYNHFFLQM